MSGSDDFYRYFNDYFNGSPSSQFAWGVLSFMFIAIAVICFINFILGILKAYALYKLSSKCQRPYPWLAWISILIPVVGIYSLIDIPGDEPFHYLGIYTFKNRRNAFWTYLIASFVFNFISGFLSVILRLVNSVPALMLVLSLLSMAVSLVITVSVLIFAYVYMKDILEVFKPDCPSNNIVAILSTFIPLMNVIVLFTLLKYEPTATLHIPEDEMQ